MPATRLRIFVSGVQKEFATLGRDLKAFLLGDAFLRRFVAEVFLFEDLPASDQRADHLYLAEVERCDIYLGIIGYEYASSGPQGHFSDGIRVPPRHDASEDPTDLRLGRR